MNTLDDIEVQASYLQAINNFKENVISRYRENINSIILFGSVARGEVGLDSDIDILVIWNGDEYHGLKELTKSAFEVLLESGLYISVKVVNPEYESRYDPFVSNIKREGIIIA